MCALEGRGARDIRWKGGEEVGEEVRGGREGGSTDLNMVLTWLPAFIFLGPHRKRGQQLSDLHEFTKWSKNSGVTISKSAHWWVGVDVHYSQNVPWMRAEKGHIRKLKRKLELILFHVTCDYAWLSVTATLWWAQSLCRHHLRGNFHFWPRSVGREAGRQKELGQIWQRKVPKAGSILTHSPNFHLQRLDGNQHPNTSKIHWQ